MPIALNMASRLESGATQESQPSRISKAAFFRARSPPIVSPGGGSNASSAPGSGGGVGGRGPEGLDDSMYARFDMATRMESGPSSSGSGRYTQESEERGYGGASDGSERGPQAGQAQGLNVPMRNSVYESTPATDGHGAMLDRPVPHPINPAAATPTSAGSSQPTPQRQNTLTRVSTRSRPPPSSQSSHSRSQSQSQSQSRPTHSRQPSTITSPHSPRGLLAGLQGVMSAPDSDSGYGESSETYESGRGGTERSPSLNEGAIMGIAAGSDVMLLTLLAGQAVMDCERLPIGGWEEVESWKKELSLLANRLDSLQSRHQREIKILTAARALQKLNTNNKRMSKQTTDSLEQSEKRVDAAEKELLILRDREATLRRRLMEHWSGVMAWEVRRLERASVDTQSRLDRHARKLSTLAAREADLVRQGEERGARIAELEEMVLEMGRRERTMEEEVREMEGLRDGVAREREERLAERAEFERAQRGWGEERRRWEREVQGWDGERARWREEKEALFGDRERLMETGKMSDKDRQVKDHVKLVLGGILGRKTGEDEVPGALEEVRELVGKREREVMNLRDEMREVNMGLEEEVKRVSVDRDAWKGKAEKGEMMRREEVASLEQSLRRQQDQITDLTLRNESLSTSLSAVQSNLSALPSPTSSQALEQRVQQLTSELDHIASQFTAIWPLLPPRSKRERAALLTSSGESNTALASPSVSVDFGALQALFERNEGEQMTGIEEALERIRGVVQDGKVLVERVVRMGKERDVLKTNASKAKALVEASTRNLETYQQQVRVLEDSLAKSGSTESHFLEELNSLQAALDNATQTKRSLEAQLASQRETCDRLSEANEQLSTRALELAQVGEDEKRALGSKLGAELEDAKKRLRECEEDADEERAKSTAQRIQLLDELNSLQAEVGDLRKQLRAKV
ncbi:hypothetical protein IAT38_001198 [Cryptococcus sp. DSM 104549]